MRLPPPPAAAAAAARKSSSDLLTPPFPHPPTHPPTHPPIIHRRGQIDALVEFPLSGLNLSGHLSSPQREEPQYDLVRAWLGVGGGGWG